MSARKRADSLVRPVKVYLIANESNGKKYVGITYLSPERRWRQHLYEAACCRSRRLLCSAIRKYGPSAFSVTTICMAENWAEACRLEAQYIEEHGSHFQLGRGYNMTYGGDGVIGLSPSQENLEKLSAANKRAAALRAELVRPAVSDLMRAGFTNYHDFSARLNAAGVPTVRGSGSWGITKVKNLLNRLGYDMGELDKIAAGDKTNMRHIKATVTKSQNYYDAIGGPVRKIMAGRPESVRHLVKMLNDSHVLPPSARSWHKTTAVKVIAYLGYDAGELAMKGRAKQQLARPLVANGVRYKSLKKAEEATGDKHIVRSIRHGRLGYYYVDEGQRSRRNRKERRPPTPVSVCGVIYAHAADAGRALGRKPDTITNRCNSKNFADHFFCDEAGKALNDSD